MAKVVTKDEADRFEKLDRAGWIFVPASITLVLAFILFGIIYVQIHEAPLVALQLIEFDKKTITLLFVGLITWYKLFFVLLGPLSPSDLILLESSHPSDHH